MKQLGFDGGIAEECAELSSVDVTFSTIGHLLAICWRFCSDTRFRIRMEQTPIRDRERRQIPVIVASAVSGTWVLVTAPDAKAIDSVVENGFTIGSVPSISSKVCTCGCSKATLINMSSSA